MKKGVAVLLTLAGSAGCMPSPDAPAMPASVSGEVPAPDGVPIRYEAHGSSDTALVLVHGWTNTRSIWGEHPRTLSSRYRTVALDLAGHGESGSERSAWTMAAFGGDIVAVVEDLGLDPVVLVGFSLGAAAVLEAAPRLEERVLGVVLVDALHDPDQPPPAETAAQMEAMFRAAGGDTAFLRAFALTPDAPDSLVTFLAAMSPAIPREHWFPALHAFVAWQSAELPSALARLEVPLAAIQTTRMPTNVEALRRFVPTFTLDTLQGVGHAGILLQRVEDFDARLIAIVERFATPP